MKIFLQVWIAFLHRNRRPETEYHLLNCLRDRYELDYDVWKNPTWTNRILDGYGHSFWITADWRLPCPLPAWAVAVVLLEKPGRFGRLTFGHEAFIQAEQHDLRLTVCHELTLRQRLLRVFPPNSTTGRRNRAYLREITDWIFYFAHIFPPEYQPQGVEYARVILQDL